MVVKDEASLEWERQEIDRAFDLCNMVFGAALGGYVGVVVANSNLRIEQAWWLCGALFPLGLALFAARELAQIVRGTHKGSITINILMPPAGVLLSLMAFSKSGFRLDVAFAIEASWFATIIFLVGIHVFRRVLGK